MKTYLYLQFKRVLRFFPFVATVSVLLFLALALILNNAIFLDSNSEEKQRFRIAIVGDSEDTYLDLALKAVETFDSSRFAIAFDRLDEETAQNELRKGSISAYIVMPDGFVRSALRGNLKPIKYITTTGTSELSSIFKDELTAIISSVLKEAQKGVYGLGNALRENVQSVTTSEHMNSFSIEYLTFILDRNNLYNTNELGISDNITLPEYLLCGISVLFLLLMGLPYAPVFVKNDYSLNKKLIIRGDKNYKQVLCEYFSYFLANLLLVCLLLLVISIAGSVMNDIFSGFIPPVSEIPSIILKIIPAILVLTALTFLFFELSENIVTGVLLYFFSTIALCYISGCFYPIYTFPQVIQDISAFLPTGLSRSYFANCITGSSYLNALWLILYSVVFLSIAILLRRYKTTGRCNG